MATNNQTKRDMERAQSRLNTQNRAQSRNTQTQSDTERAANRTKADTARAASRTKGAGGGSGSDDERMKMPTMSVRVAVNGLTGTTAGGLEQGGQSVASAFDTSRGGDPFYNYQNKARDDDATDFVVHGDTNNTLPSSQEAFAAIICVNGKPHYASIQGRIGDEIE